MKKMIALILAAILLSASCITLAEEEKPNGFEVTFNFNQDMCFKGVTSINNFLASWPLSKLEIKDQTKVYAIVTNYLSDGTTTSYPIAGLINCTLYGERDESADLYCYQIDVPVRFRAEDETWEAFLAQWDNEHPDFSRKFYIVSYTNLNDQDAISAIIIYTQPSL